MNKDTSNEQGDGLDRIDRELRMHKKLLWAASICVPAAIFVWLWLAAKGIEKDNNLLKNSSPPGKNSVAKPKDIPLVIQRKPPSPSGF